ncbi:TRAP transporter small permease [Primorskyibacter aestuariivivens]|uniref:TRAP transporter small permease subunit n=1 Tax=Primorskyibacter aestuariivivens TaxID=1888912 RepID=UPI0023001C62|nr:TRAP transporter small permease [Primorskyibacter aestuariivivens]MDA7429538.1 TRAP transporter small permease [Primorskyibacter aestuariivivens]
MDTRESVWLGSLRQPVKLAAIGLTGLALALFTWLVLNRIFAAESIGMHEMIRPEGRPIVTITLLAIAGAILLVSLYLSDTRESIEHEPSGFFDVFSLICSRIAMIMTVLVVIVMFYEVVSRYVFSRPTLWANELSLWIAAFVFLLAGQYAMQQRSHIRIYVIYDMMPRWMQKTSDVISLLLIWFFTFAMVWGGYDDAMRRFLRMETFGTAWDPPIPGIVKPAILIIICLVAIQALSNLISDWNRAPEHHGLDDIDEVEIENIRKALEK